MSKTARKQAKKAPTRKAATAKAKATPARKAAPVVAKAKSARPAPKHVAAKPAHAPRTDAKPLKPAAKTQPKATKPSPVAKAHAPETKIQHAKPAVAAHASEARTHGKPAAAAVAVAPPALTKAGKKAGKAAAEKIELKLPPTTPEDRQSQLKLLIARGKEQSFLTYAEVNDHLPSEIVDPEQIEDIVQMINDMGIPVYEKAPDAEA